MVEVFEPNAERTAQRAMPVQYDLVTRRIKGKHRLAAILDETILGFSVRINLDDQWISIAYRDAVCRTRHRYDCAARNEQRERIERRINPHVCLPCADCPCPIIDPTPRRQIHGTRLFIIIDGCN